MEQNGIVRSKLKSHSVVRGSGLSEAGVAMLEFAIAVLGIVAGIIIVLDLGLAISQYTLLSQAAQEGARMLSQLPELEESPLQGFTDIQPSDDEVFACLNGQPSAVPCQHYLAQERIRTAVNSIAAFDSVRLLTVMPQITTHYIPTGAGLGPADDTVAVELRSVYRGLFLPNLTIAVDQQAAYLFEVS